MDPTLTLNAAQHAVVERGLLSVGYSCVLQMPTGSGKTRLAEEAIAEVLAAGGRAIYLVPLRALAAEVAGRWRRRFGASQVGCFTGEDGGARAASPFAQARLLVMTPERLDACTRRWQAHWGWLPEVELVVVDELHLLGDPRRGPRLEGTLLRVQRLNPFARLVGLSATLGNRGEIADWWGGVEFAADERPIPLTWRVATFRRADEKPALLVQEVSRVVAGGGSSLVFVQSRQRAETLSALLAGQGLRVRAHHGGLPLAARQAVEAGLRAGAVEVVVATSTLEMGLNLPVRQVVLYDLHQFDGESYQPLPVSTIWQRVGRAGRPGLDMEGEALLMVPRWEAQAARAYTRGAFEPVRSHLGEPAALAEQVLVEVASGLARTRLHLAQLFACSLAARQGVRLDVAGAVEKLAAAGLLTEGERGRLVATHLGQVATRYFLAPATARRFHCALACGPLTAFDLLVVAACNAECELPWRVEVEEREALRQVLRRERSVLFARPAAEVLGLLAVDEQRLLAALKMARVAQVWGEQGNTMRAARMGGISPGEVQRLGEALARLLAGLGAVAGRQMAPVPSLAASHEQLRTLLRQLAAAQHPAPRGDLSLVNPWGGPSCDSHTWRNEP